MDIKILKLKIYVDLMLKLQKFKIHSGGIHVI